jgi:hypothetical protein
MTELQIFAEVTHKHGGEWWELEQGKHYSLHACKTKYMVNGRVFYNPPVYQVFNAAGKRIFASTSYKVAYDAWKNKESEGG